MTDRGIPNRLCRLDPRTGEITEFMMPTVSDSLHGVTIDPTGIVWTAELTPAAGHESHLNGFDPKTGTFQRYPMDPDHVMGPSVGVNSISTDSKGNIWFTFSTKGQGLGEFDPNTKKISLHKIPTEKGMPYGIDFDREDNPWIAEFAAGKVAKFDVKDQKWTEYSPPSQPAKIRRLGLDPNGTVWFGIYNRGLLGRLDPETGKVTEIKVPSEFSLPYEAWSDYKDSIWFGDGGMGGAIIHYEPKSGSFTYFPTAQITDAPKVEITREGAIWFSPRSADEVGGAVLYPDMTKITTLAAYYRGYSPVTARYGVKANASN
jgi:virginiamycin B lyase